MALELQIISPKPGQRFPEIKWNNEELKQEVVKVVSDYQNLVVTLETEKDCKETRAKLNKLRTAIEDARKDMKKRVNEPLKRFEQQVKEVEAPIDTAIQNLDTQLDEIKVMRQEQKKKQIHDAYEKGEAPEWLNLEQIWEDKWLNVSVTMNDIIKAIDEKIRHINANLEVIANLPDFAYEAEELYKQTLDFKGAIEQAKQMSLILKKRKAEAEASKNMPESPRNEEVKQEIKPDVKKPGDQEKIYNFTFEVAVTATQAKLLGDFCKSQGITLTRIK